MPSWKPWALLAITLWSWTYTAHGQASKGPISLRERLRQKLDAVRTEPQVDPATTDLYHLPDGPCEIESWETLTLQDTKRDKSLPLRVTFPRPAGHYPVIVFSHGASGSKNGYQPLTQYWASHGYVVIQPTHGDSLTLLSAEERRKIGSLQQYVTSAAVAKHWRSRAEDVTFLLDSLESIESQVAGLAGKVDRTRVGVGGHSYGAQTTQVLAGLTTSIPLLAGRFTLRDDRPRAFLMISPQGPGKATDASSYAAMDRPILMVTGTQDDSPSGHDYQWRLKAFEHVPPGNKFLLFIEDAHHNFGGISGVRYEGAGAPNPDHVYYVKSTSLAFWDAYLKDRADALEYLKSDQVKSVTRGVAEVRRKL